MKRIYSISATILTKILVSLILQGYARFSSVAHTFARRLKLDTLLPRHFWNRVAGIFALVARAALLTTLMLNVGASHVHVEKKHVHAQATVPKLKRMVAPLFIENWRFTSTLVLVNGSRVSTYVEVVVAELSGREITRQRVEFLPYSQRQVHLREVLSAAGSSATTGRIDIIRSPEDKGLPLAAHLLLTDLGSGEPVYIDEEGVIPSASGSQTLRAVTDTTDGSPLIAIASLSDSEQRITIESFSGIKRFSKTVTLAAGETLVTEADQEGTLHGAPFEMISGNAGRRGARRPVGITLTSNAAPGSFAAFGLAPHEKRGHQFFCAVSFADPHMLHGTTTVFTGVPVGSSTLLSEGRYAPRIALANFSPKDLNVSVKYVRSSGGSPTVQEVANVKVGAMSTEALSLDNLAGDPQLKNSFLVTSDGAHGDLMAKLVSTSEGRLREVDLSGKNEKAHEVGGNHPWSLDQSTESTLLLFNHGAKPQRFDVIISGGGVLWRKAYELTSMQTEAISIRSLIQDQVMDDKGKTLPYDAVSGQIGWFAPGRPNGKGRILQSSPELAMARNFSFRECAVLCDARFDKWITTMEAGDSFVWIGTAVPLACPTDQPTECPVTTPSDQYNIGVTYNNLRSSNTNVVQVVSIADWGDVFVNAVGPGKAFVHVDIEDNDHGCMATASMLVTVVKVDILDESGNVITSQARDVIVGRKIRLTSRALPDGATNVQWNIPGLTMANYAKDAATTEPDDSAGKKTTLTTQDLSQEALTFYWIDGGDNREVKLTATVNGQPFEASTMFNVKRPTVDIEIVTKEITIDTATGRLELHYGVNQTGQQGIAFTRKNLNIPSGFSGTTEWIQIASPSRERTMNDGSKQTLQGTGLDAPYPYNSSQTDASDSPGQKLDNTFLNVSIGDRYTMWLMFKPSGTDARWVPLRKVTWGWDAAASRSGDSWMLNSPLIR